MFEGKEGYRIYKNKGDAEFLARLAREKGVQTKVLKIRVKNGDEAEKEGFTIHEDISIAASPPSTGQRRWIVLKGDDKIQEGLKKAIEIID
ncbi:hypothetical protein AKJ51_05185 [candidate division MSBL1 archaeon SCGC-AAA382A20]|uniref:Uncharacterized protein n=1 Tax=candidate division MSBL1 archaeon SCGC-AAA382A20 TaxID=1698280 RepID=A0A133VFN6_9EURY|nr:hypothetical protein AKJ51_05185 [candidate division MSBL1 archaeon SCGC-AAA382A20]